MASKTYIYRDLVTGCEMFNVAHPHVSTIIPLSSPCKHYRSWWYIIPPSSPCEHFHPEPKIFIKSKHLKGNVSVSQRSFKPLYTMPEAPKHIWARCALIAFLMFVKQNPLFTLCSAGCFQVLMISASRFWWQRTMPSSVSSPWWSMRMGGGEDGSDVGHGYQPWDLPWYC